MSACWISHENSSGSPFHSAQFCLYCFIVTTVYPISSRFIAECKSYHINLQACQYVTVDYATYVRECPWAFEFHRIAPILGLPTRKIKERIKDKEDNRRNGMGRTMSSKMVTDGLMAFDR
jgi:hypothetical protein